MVVHLTDQSITEVHSNSLDGLILSGWLQDFQQQLVDPTILELQLLWNTEVTQSQAAVPLDLIDCEAGKGTQRVTQDTRFIN